MQSIILKKSVFSEGNEIITIYTRELGKVRAVARAVKSIKSKLAYGLQTLFYSEVELIQSKKMHQIIGVRVLNTFKKLRENKKTIYAALYAAELVLKSTPDEQPNEQLFDALLKFLEHLDANPNQPHPCSACFVLNAMALNGYGINAEVCVICNKKLSDSQQLYFSTYKSGFLCEKDAEHVSDAAAVSVSLYEFIRGCQRGDFNAADHLPVDHREAFNFAQNYASYILERNLNTGKFLV